MAARWFDRPGVAFTWIAVELVAFVILLGVAMMWVPHIEKILIEAGVAISPAALQSIAIGRCLGAYAWLLIPFVLLSLFVKAGIVHAQPAKARMVAISAVAIALLFLVIALFLVACLTQSVQAVATTTDAGGSGH